MPVKRRNARERMRFWLTGLAPRCCARRGLATCCIASTRFGQGSVLHQGLSTRQPQASCRTDSWPDQAEAVQQAVFFFSRKDKGEEKEM